MNEVAARLRASLGLDLTAGFGPRSPPAAGLGFAALDEALGGGLLPGSHQVAAKEAGDAASALGFAAAVATRALAARPGQALLVQAGEAVREIGFAYAPGLHALGLDPDRVGVVNARNGVEALKVVDEALRSGAVAVVVADLWEEPRLDLSATRRFNLSGRRNGAVALLVTRDLEATSAALTRWRVESGVGAASRRRLGAPVFRLELVRNRTGPTGEWTVEWNSHERAFRPTPSLPLPVARPAADRPGTAVQKAFRQGAEAASGAHREAG